MTQKKRKLSTLFNKIFKERASDEEQKLANSWYDQLNLNPQEVFHDLAEEEQIREKMRVNLYTYAHKEKTKQGKIISLYWIRSAAAILFLCVLSVLVYIYASGKRRNADLFKVASGNQAIKRFTLPDGTKVTLNLASSLSWDKSYNGKERKVSLKGEAFFDVKKDKEHPFIVVSNRIQTRVLGTAFDVESYPSESQIKVSLVRGKVRIMDKSNALNKAVLVPGQMMDYSLKTGALKVKPIAVANIDAWIRGGLTFNDIPLVSAIERLARKYNLQIKYDQQKLNNLTVTASFDAVSWQEALQSILFTQNMHYVLKENTVYIQNN